MHILCGLKLQHPPPPWIFFCGLTTTPQAFSLPPTSTPLQWKSNTIWSPSEGLSGGWWGFRLVMHSGRLAWTFPTTQLTLVYIERS